MAHTPNHALPVLPLVEALAPITLKVANGLLADGGHYLGRMSYAPRLILADHDGGGEVVALSAFADPVAAHFKRALPGCWELTRLWQSDDRRERRLEFDTLSAFVRACLDWIKAHRPDVPCVFSYADPGAGHTGDVYHAARFRRLGASRVTDLWEDRLSGDVVTAERLRRVYGSKDRARLAREGYTLIERPGKVLFVRGLTMDAGQVRKAIGGRYSGREG